MRPLNDVFTFHIHSGKIWIEQICFTLNAFFTLRVFGTYYFVSQNVFQNRWKRNISINLVVSKNDYSEKLLLSLISSKMNSPQNSLFATALPNNRINNLMDLCWPQNNLFLRIVPATSSLWNAAEKCFLLSHCDEVSIIFQILKCKYYVFLHYDIF